VDLADLAAVTLNGDVGEHFSLGLWWSRLYPPDGAPQVEDF